MRLIFHGVLKELYGPSFEIHAESVADGIEGFSRQVDNWPKDLRIAAVGFGTVEKLQLSAKEVNLMPALIGGGGKFGSIILGAALIGLAIATAGAGAAGGIALLGVHVTSGALLLSGSLMVLTGVMGLFMKAPKIQKSNDPEASKYISQNKNTTQVGTPITLAWGRIDLGGQWISIQSDSSNLSYGTFPTTP